MARPATISAVAWKARPGQDLPQALAESSALIEHAARAGSDLVILPELFLHGALPPARWLEAAPLPNAITDHFAGLCRQREINLAVPMPVRDGQRVFNSSVVLDRRGQIVGRYDKVCPTRGELAAGIAPGAGPVALELDFGRVGQAICFDLNFPQLAEAYQALDVDLLTVPSMFAGGPLLEAWALTVGACVVSAYSEEGRAVDMTGRELARIGTRYEAVRDWGLCPVLTVRLNLDRRLFHLDGNVADFDGQHGGVHRLLRECPDRVTTDYEFSAGVVALGAREGTTLAELIERFDLELRHAYFARSRRALEQRKGS